MKTLLFKTFIDLDSTVILNQQQITFFTSLMKFFLIFNSYQYTTETERSQVIDTLDFKSLLDNHDLIQHPEKCLLTSIPFCLQLQKERLESYEKLYTQAIQCKTTKRNKQLSQDLIQQLLTCDTIEEFKQLLKNGVIFDQFSLKFESYKDEHFWTFFHLLTRLTTVEKHQVKTTLRCQKIMVVLLAKDTITNEIIWNHGNLVFVHNFQHISKLFYQDGLRTEWIDFCAKYLEAKRQQGWKYRDTDLPNRHSHHISKPSFFGLGYESIEEFKANVSETVYQEYCSKHTYCCGFNPKQKQNAEKTDENEDNLGLFF
jgi:hypothetical protein